MPSYAKFLKEVLSNKRKWEGCEMVKLNEECSAILQNKLPKFRDLWSFSIPCTIGHADFDKALCDLADRNIKYPRRIVEDVLTMKSLHEKEHDIFAIDSINTLETNDAHLVKYDDPKENCIEKSNGDNLWDIKEKYDEVSSFVDIEQEVKSKLQKESEDKGGQSNRAKRWRNQVDQNVGLYKEHTTTWNESLMRTKKFKGVDKRHHKNKGPIRVDWQRLKHYIEWASPPVKPLP
ncbi:hypothetical protein Sango_2884900 [Sesamum angolense]|uniref:Uncharacterized protein n=1 Tax=Sesamum angolense TaxID=2727404 RepID=A0AAE1T5J4_9LAMI|nr:hypothetical protein Sango_2884900 [Sesamum angolense]